MGSFLFYTHIREAGLRPRRSAAGTKSWARTEGLDGRRGGLPALGNTPLGACSQAALLNAGELTISGARTDATIPVTRPN